MAADPTPQPATVPEFDSPEQEVFLNLGRTYSRLRALADELFGRHELTAQQYHALWLLRDAHPQSLPTIVLAKRLLSRAPDITRLVDKLVQRHLVVRERRRRCRQGTTRVGITATGLALLEALVEPLRVCHARQVGHLSRSDLLQLCALLRAAREPHEDAYSSWC
jgi:DNA-binding MarR family transcriptional regulator